MQKTMVYCTVGQIQACLAPRADSLAAGSRAAAKFSRPSPLP